MASPDTQQQQDGKASRTQNARRYGGLGFLAGAVYGLISGGGLLSALKMAMVGGGASALGGIVAGNKLNPFVDKVMDKLPWNKKEANGQANAPQQGHEQAPTVIQREAAPTHQQGNAAQIFPGNRRPVELDENALRDVHSAGKDIGRAREGMPPEVQALTASSAARPAKLPTHDAGISSRVH